MSRFEIDSIGFDLDGTLWDGTAAIAESWKTCFEQEPCIEEIPTPKQLEAMMGLPISEILIRLFPGLTQEQRDSIMEQCRLAESSYIIKNGGRLYESIELLKRVFQTLSEKYSLYIVSNCQDGYIQAFLQHYGLQEYFCDIECWGATKLSKGENIRLLMKRNGFQNSLYVGDTQGDYDAACKAGVPFIWAAYGFGQVDSEVDFIEKLSDLLTKGIC